MYSYVITYLIQFNITDSLLHTGMGTIYREENNRH